MKMPFGKFEGIDTADLPLDYIEWLLSIDLRPPLKGAVDREWRSRAKSHSSAPVSREDHAVITLRVPISDASLLQELVTRGFKAAARVHHPDAGGNAAEMTRLNRLVADLRAQIEVIA